MSSPPRDADLGRSPVAAPPATGAGAARARFDLAIERVYLRVLAAVARRRPGATAGAAARIAVDVEGVDERLAALGAGDDDADPMARLARRFGLSADAVDFLWTAVALAADPRVVPHAHTLIGSEARRGLSLNLYNAIAELDGDRCRTLALTVGPAHPLLRFHLLTVTEPGATAVSAPLAASSRLVAYLAGGRPALGWVSGAGSGRLTPPARPRFDPAQALALRRVGDALAAADSLVLVVEGPLGSGRRTAVARAAADLGRDVLAIDVRRMASGEDALAEAVSGLLRDCLLCDAIPLVAELDDLHDDRAGSGDRLRLVARLIDAMPGIVVVTSAMAGIELGVARPTVRVTWPVPDADTRRALWGDFLAGTEAPAADELEHLAMRYRLGAGGIQRAVDTARVVAQSADGADRAGPAVIAVPDLIHGVHDNIAERLGTLAERFDVKQDWGDLVLSDDTRDSIHALIARVRYAHRVYEQWGFHKKTPRGIGVPALFSGPPGTGKSMVAGLIARELKLELYQVDLSQVVSKWVGETEKQLARVFDAAEAGHALLLFDEADALFAKRTEVKGANDRYANLEVNFLLQRIERFGGITILTTNLDASIDSALKRRLAGHIVFWPPDEDERADLWRRFLTTGSAPVAADLDFVHLARLFPDMTGANIRNAVLAGAFLAASEDSEITRDYLERAARSEYRTMGRVLR